MKYSVVALQFEDEYLWAVVETATENLIDTFFFEDEALELAEFMEYGGAFNGFTPAFMLKPVPSNDLNAKFEQFIA